MFGVFFLVTNWTMHWTLAMLSFHVNYMDGIYYLKTAFQ